MKAACLCVLSGRANNDAAQNGEGSFLFIVFDRVTFCSQILLLSELNATIYAHASGSHRYSIVVPFLSRLP